MLAAFLIFRFDIEDGEHVAYVCVSVSVRLSVFFEPSPFFRYELQVAGGFQRSGLGVALMSFVCDIGKTWAMRKIMLTVLQGRHISRLCS